MIKIAIFGLGGVGGYIGAKLTQKGLAEVTFFARGKHLRAIQKDGLKVIDTDEEFRVKPKNLIDTSDDTSDEIFDIIFVCVKSYSFEKITPVLNSHIDENSLIIPLSNGVNHRVELNNFIDKGTVLDGCIYVLSNIKEYGVIEKKALTFYLVFGDYKNRFQLRLQKLVDILNQSSLKSKLSQDIEYDCWVKYLLISSFATMTSYYNKPLGYIAKEKMSELKEVLNEIKSVANALGVDIGDKEIEKTIKQVQNVPHTSKTSMQIDFENSHKTELESLTGYIVQNAKNLDLEVKIMKKMYEKLSVVCV
jgi:2-dehydropantoate 2-reductase